MIDFELFKKKELLQDDKCKYFLFNRICQNKTIRYIHRHNSWINSKKLLGLKYINEQFDYEYIIICDSEIKFLKKNIDYYSLIKSVCDKAIILGTDLNGECNIIQSINSKCISVLPNEWHNTLIEITNNKTFLAWFSNIPIYEKKYLSEFFDTLGINFIYKLSYFSFDYVIYYLFLCYKGYWKLQNIKEYGYSDGLECSIDEKMFKDVSSKFPLLWVSNRIYIKCVDYIENKNCNVFIIFHLDRN
jgi:hypothetical protein